MVMLARDPDRVMPAKEVAEAMGLSYHQAWSSLRRLKLKGLIGLDGLLCRKVRVALGVDGWTCETCGAHHEGRRPPHLAPAADARPDPAPPEMADDQLY